MKLGLLLCLNTLASGLYFFNGRKVQGLDKNEWLARCQEIFQENPDADVAIFKVNELCTQLRCMKAKEAVVVAFDLCVRSSVECFYKEPATNLPYPECCPQQQCLEGAGLLSYEKYQSIVEAEAEENITKT